jgi:hypothetical protein
MANNKHQGYSCQNKLISILLNIIHGGQGFCIGTANLIFPICFFMNHNNQIQFSNKQLNNMKDLCQLNSSMNHQVTQRSVKIKELKRAMERQLDIRNKSKKKNIGYRTFSDLNWGKEIIIIKIIQYSITLVDYDCMNKKKKINE